MTPFTLSTRANWAQLHGQRTGLRSQLKCGMVSAGYEARLQACDSRRCRNNIPFPIPPLAGRHPRNSSRLSGWLELQSPADVPPCSARAGFHPGVLTAGADRELVLWPFLTLCPDTAWSPLALPVSSRPSGPRVPLSREVWRAHSELPSVELGVSLFPVPAVVSH